MGFGQQRNSYSVLQDFLLIFSCFLGFTTAIDSIRVNQSLRDPETLVSNGGKFKLGFFSPPNSSYHYVGIMYNLPVMTVIWVANRDKPLNDSTGSVEISEDGNLVILDGGKEIVWSTNLSSSVANSSAGLLDTGNLVLQDNSNNDSVWESFNHASDSLLEKLRIFTDLNTNRKSILTSWRSPSDPAPGSFTCTIEPQGNPELFVWKDGFPYWRSGPWNDQIFSGIPSVESFYELELNVVHVSPRHAYLSFTLLNPSVLIYYVLNTSGNLVQKTWSDKRGEWMTTWSSIENECDIYGKCGPFGSCNIQERPICNCLQGFEPRNKDEWNAENWYSGCTRKNSLQCGKNNSVGGKQDQLVKLERAKMPDHGALFPSKEEECSSQCMNNCSCIAYAYATGIGCMQWADNLTDVQVFSNGGTDLYIRLPYSKFGNKKDRKAIIVTTVVLGSITIPVCAYFLWKLWLKYRGRKPENVLIHSTTEETDTGCSQESMLQHNVHGLEELPLFKLEILSNATDKFDLTHKLGQGGFGPVYRGKLPNGQEIAVKRLATSSNQGLREFMNEVKLISRLQHRNLVRLLGCCVENEEKMLVYEYMPNGSLDAYLFGSPKQEFLDWPTRMIIIQGICRGLLYLHRDSRLRIIHRDLKASNILLDEELNPKISDFGMARIFGGKDDQANTTRVVGTYGYMSPEYVLHGIFSEKSDVYSLGVLLLEIVSGRRNSRFYDEDQRLFLIAYALKLWNEKNIVDLMDPVIYNPGIEADILRYANVGLLCVQEIAADRPNVSTVLSMLSCEITELPRPKQPAFLAIQRHSETESSQKNSSKYSANNVTVTIVEGR